MKKVLGCVVALVGVLMLSMGLRWLLAPAGMAAQLGMPLLEGAGLSTQVGDLAAFFLCIGLFVLIGLSTGKAHWYYPAIMLLSITAVARILAWLLHDAALSLDAIGVEIIFSVILLLAARFLGNKPEAVA